MNNRQNVIVAIAIFVLIVGITAVASTEDDLTLLYSFIAKITPSDAKDSMN